MGTNAIDGPGNSLANTLTGNAASNRLDGGAGADNLAGGEGDDASKPNQTQCRKVEGGWKINGFKEIRQPSPSYCDYYTIVCTEVFEGIEPRHEDTVLFVVHKDAPGLSVKGDWDPLGMRGTNSRDLILKDVFVSADDMLMPPGIFGKTLPNWPHMMATLSPTYMGVAQGAYDFMVAYLQGKLPGQPPIDRRMYATKRITVGKIYARLANMRALWWQAFGEAKGFPSRGRGDADVCRAIQRHGGCAGDCGTGNPHLWGGRIASLHKQPATDRR